MKERIEEIAVVYMPIILLWFVAILFIFACLGFMFLLLKLLLGI